MMKQFSFGSFSFCLTLLVGMTGLHADNMDAYNQDLSNSLPSQKVMSRALAPSVHIPRNTRQRAGVNSGMTNPLTVSHLTLAKNIKSLISGGDKSLVSSKQQAALKQLKKDTGAGSTVVSHFYNRKGTPTFVKVAPTPLTSEQSANPASPEQRAESFLDKNKVLLKLGSIENELALSKRADDEQGKTHLTYQRVVKGVPVWGSELKVHLNKDKQVYSVNGRYEPSKHVLNTTPSLSKAEALDKILDEFDVASVYSESSKLTIYPQSDSKWILAYEFDVLVTFDQRWTVFIDARTGEMVKKFSTSHHAGSAVAASGTGVFGQTQNFTAWSQDATYYMIDPTFPLNDPTHDPIDMPKSKGDTIIWDAENGTGAFAYSTSNSATSGWDPAAVTAMKNTRTVYDYFKNTHSRNGIDNTNMNFQVVIHYGVDYDNAFWNGTFMVFGDGGTAFEPLVNCLDVTAHEMSHGVIEHSANLIYQNQSGALNEAFADIFGAMVDRDDWLMGEDCTKGSLGYLRNLQNPNLGNQPKHMSQFVNLPNTQNTDNGGVHINSGIPNRAAYLLAEGLTAEGLGNSIGKNKMEDIFYRALTFYLTPNSYFIDARDASIQAAEDIYGVDSLEVDAVKAAWDGVGVTSDYQDIPNQAPTDTDAVVGDDIMFYFFPIDGTRDFDSEDQYALFAQIMNSPLSYDEELDLSMGNLVSGTGFSKPAVFTDDDEFVLMYVGSDLNVYAINLVTEEELQITNTGDIYNVAISPNGRYVAFSGDFGANIFVMDLVNETSQFYPLLSPSYVTDTDNFSSIQYADSIAFDHSGRYIAFDAKHCVSYEGSDCGSGGGLSYWSIGMLQAADGELSYPFPNQSPDIDLGFPAFAANNNYVVAVDIQDFSPGTYVNNAVISINFNDQEIELVHDIGAYTGPVYGVPTFWGEDLSVTVQLPSGDSAGTNAQRISLGTNGDNRWEGSNSVLDLINPYAVAMPLMHREGARTGAASLSGPENINFGETEKNSSKTKTITISNNGSSDVEITNITITGEGFSHNGTNLLLPRGESFDIRIVFQASNVEQGTHSGKLTFDTYFEKKALDISLMADVQVIDNNSQTFTKSGGGSSGGGSLSYTFLLVIFLTLARRRYLV